MRERFYVVDDGGTGSCKARHGFKKGRSYIRDIPADKKGQHTENAEDDPRKCHDEVSVTARHAVIGIASEQLEAESGYHGEDNSNGECRHIVFAVVERHDTAERQQ